ncbi:MAG: aldehyde ferredoxin oxidoreductase N-terminal domain-containing protein, partial [Candidatus Thermoplasmatota archaeon]
MFGYTCKILSVDLTTSRIKILNINEELFKKFIGGMGLGSKILYDSLKPDVDALSPENLLIFATGPLTGLALPSSASFSIVTRSPLTNIFYSSTMRGNLGTKLKQAGFDMLVIKGASSSPVFLQIEENDCKIIGALDLWRKNIYQTDKILKSELGKDFAIAAIGIGGEKLVRFASINTDLYEHCVGGAVMGSKNLKAIAVNGKNRLQYYNFDKFKLVARKIFKKIRNCKDRICELRNRSYFSRDFTLKPMLQSLSVMSELEKNLLPTKNFQSASLGA